MEEAETGELGWERRGRHYGELAAEEAESGGEGQRLWGAGSGRLQVARGHKDHRGMKCSSSEDSKQLSNTCILYLNIFKQMYIFLIYRI